MTIATFTQLYNTKRKAEGKHEVTFSIEKSKVIKKRQDTYVADEYGRPQLTHSIPAVSKRVVDTNGITKLYQCMWSYYLHTDLKRISSEGSYRPGVGFIPNTNRGIADLMGGYEGKVYYIEVKQRKEKLLSTQIKFKAWVESFGGEYHIVHDFDEMYSLICNIKSK